MNDGEHEAGVDNSYLDEMIMMGNVLCTIYTDGVRLVHRWFGQP